MNKFLYISGVIFWIQVLALSSYGLYQWYQFNHVGKEVDSFISEFNLQILKNRSNEHNSIFFDKSFDKTDLVSIQNALEKLGQYKACNFQSSVEFPGPASTIQANCDFQNSSANLNIAISKKESLWLINKIRITSDIFQISL